MKNLLLIIISAVLILKVFIPINFASGISSSRNITFSDLSDSHWAYKNIIDSLDINQEDLAKKPENIREKIVEGRLHKILAQKCLLEQGFVKDPSQTVAQLIEGKLKIVKFDRYVLGEGIEKRQENFADEVAKQIKG